MTALEHIERLLPQLTPDERERVASLVAPVQIQHTPGVNGGSARIRQTRIAVWTLEEARREGMSNEVILEMYPALSLGDLEATWRYVAQNPEEIECDIRENEEEA